MSTDDPHDNPTDPQQDHDSLRNPESNEPLDAALREEAAGEDDLKKVARWKRGLIWLKSNRLIAVAIVVLLLLAILSGVTLSLLGGSSSNRKKIQMAMDALEEGSFSKARKIAKLIATQTKGTPQDQADAAFILGMAAADDAEVGWPDDRSSYILAARYFDIAYSDGFPEKFNFIGLKTYGKVLLRCDQFVKSQKILEEVLKLAEDEPEKTEIRFLLVEADLSAENPDLTEAIRQNKAYLKTKGLTKQQRTKGILQQLQIQTRQGQFEKARSNLDKLSKNPGIADKVYYAKGRLAMRQAEKGRTDVPPKTPDQIRAKLEEAIDSFRRAQGHANESNPMVPRSQYLIGLCLEQLGESRAAIQQWKQVCEFFPDLPEAVASKYRLAEIYFYEEATEDNPHEAIKYFKQVTDALAEEGYTNPWITMAEVRKNAIQRIGAFRKQKKLQAALDMAEAIVPLMDRQPTIRLLAKLNRDLGQKMLDELKSNIGNKEQALKSKEARQHFRKASLLFTELARQGKATRAYSEDLWQSAECALKGNDFFRAARTYIKYLNLEPLKRNAPALVGLGEAYLALGEIDEAIDTLEQCIDFYPTEVATFRARLLAAGAWQEKGDLKPAEQLLLENWSAPGMTPRSLVWRDSLYRLGELYHNTKDYNKAIKRLSDVARRFPNDPRTNLARYFLANSYRLRANKAQVRIKKTMTRSKLSSQKAHIQSDLNNAYRQYQLLLQQIGLQRGMAELSELDNRLLRNSRIFAAGVLFQLKQYNQAIKAYSNVSLHYQGQPISIQTMKQDAQALADLGKNVPAQNRVRRTIKQLEKMGSELPYEETTLYSYSEWMNALKRMEKEISLR